MKFTFKDQDSNTILDSITSILSGRKLGKMVSLEPEAQGLIVKISKMGTSKLIFDRLDTEDGFELILVKEKIALSHKAFKGEVTEKFIEIVKQAGGQVED